MIAANAGAPTEVPPTPEKFSVAGVEVELVDKSHRAPFAFESDWQMM